MPVIAATSAPQEAATIRSRRRGVWGFCCVTVMTVAAVAVRVQGSQRAHQNSRSFHKCDDVEQDHEHAEHERNRNRARAPPALLLLGEDDPLRLVVHRATLRPHPMLRPNRPPLSISRTANTPNR